uniref:Short-chain alcohol dehydrogenase n=1 Tax=uncultured organism TaxID=155900 RepID=A0A090BCM2_9ZZZZ|nr:short-chain alcohol dehydrogenase [uncultured organism]
MAQYDVADRSAIVTGASSGLGRRFVQVLRDAGAEVVAAARRTDRLEALAAETGAVPVTADVSDPEDVDRLVATTLERFGRVDVLVNNAGIGTTVPAEDEPIEEFCRVFDVNVTSLFRLSQAVGRHMLAAGRGSIVNVASILGLVASAPIKQAGYAASKGAVVNLTRELGCQWARKGVRVNAIAPGWFPSEMTQHMFGDERSEEFVRRNCPMGRFGTETELDGALLFLAGDASTYVTGHVLVVDGGYTAQ